MEFDKKLLIIRARLKLNQAQLAEILGVSLVTINRWENKQSKPSKVALIRLDDFCKEQGLLLEEKRYD